jgi:phosphoribosylformylglycinamidine cyclo-ligase
MEKTMTYAGSGVDYDVMDKLKRRGQELAMLTHGNLARMDDRFKNKVRIVPESIGESAIVYDDGSSELIADLVEGLGTKNIVAEKMEEVIKVALLMEELSGGKLTDVPGAIGVDPDNLFSGLGQCALAMIVNDLITVGAWPCGVNMYLAASDAQWFENESRWEAILQGWKRGCDLAGCAWGGGETPTLKGIVEKGTCELAGSGWGKIPDRHMLHGSRIRPGDVIILYASSGVHANGYTLAREIAEKLPQKFFTKMPSGQTYGEALLEPTLIYAKALNGALAKGADVHYAINITGHGWRKIMRANEKFRYEIFNVPELQEIFKFMMEKGPIDIREAYANLNMGAGFAVIVGALDAQMVLDAAEEDGISAWSAGLVKKDNKKSVVIHNGKREPIIFTEKEMKIR